MTELSVLDLQNLRHLIGGFETTPVSYTHLLLILYTITKFSPEKAAPIHFKNFRGSY